jgi:hypothetical protein
MKKPEGKMWVMHHLFQPDQDEKDKLILELLGTIGTHPNYQDKTSSLIFELHKGYAGLPTFVGTSMKFDKPWERPDYRLS